MGPDLKASRAGPENEEVRASVISDCAPDGRKGPTSLYNSTNELVISNLTFPLPPACRSISAHRLKMSVTARGTRPVVGRISRSSFDPASRAVPIEYDFPDDV